jgi:hypothetical protein
MAAKNGLPFLNTQGVKRRCRHVGYTEDKGFRQVCSVIVSHRNMLYSKLFIKVLYRNCEMWDVLAILRYLFFKTRQETRHFY